MKYCNNCGEIMKDRASICPSCGMKINSTKKLTQEQYDNIFLNKKVFSQPKKAVVTQPRAHILGRKSMLLAIILSIIFPGSGVLYAGNKKLGLYIISGFFFVIAIDLLSKLGFQNYFLGIPLYLGIFVWSVTSAIRSVRRFNQPLEKDYGKQLSINKKDTVFGE